MAEHSRLERFLILARSTKGAAAAKVVLDATAANGVYTFSELMDVPNVRELSNDPTYAQHVKLLQLFAYGTLKDYLAAPDTFPSLTPAHKTKLKHLTLVSMALSHRSLSYSELSDALQVSSTRELETLIIDAIYAGLLGAKMHQHKQTLHIDWVTGRDVRPDDIAHVKAGLETWCQNASTLLAALDQQIAAVRHEAAAEAESEAVYQKHLDEAFLVARKEVEHRERKGRSQAGVDEAFSGEHGGMRVDQEDADWQQAISESLLEQNQGPVLGGGRGSARTTDARSVESIDEPRKKRAKD